MSWTPRHYVDVLYDFYYRKSMMLLKMQYEFQIEHFNEPYLCIAYFLNFESFLSDSFNYSSPLVKVQSARHDDAVLWFLQSFGFNNDFDINMVKSCCDNSLYQLEVDDIVINADKSKKVNSVSGISPHIV